MNEESQNVIMDRYSLEKWPRLPSTKLILTHHEPQQSRIVVPRLKCGRGECVGEATGNPVKSVQNNCGRRRPWSL